MTKPTRRAVLAAMAGGARLRGADDGFLEDLSHRCTGLQYPAPRRRFQRAQTGGTHRHNCAPLLPRCLNCLHRRRGNGYHCCAFYAG